jgi:hypothetical protein
MRLHEIMEDVSAATTGSSAIAVAAQPLGAVQRRIPDPQTLAKYSNRPAKDYASPKRNKNAR